MSWSSNDLSIKARLFANYAGELEADDHRYPLWMALSLEMLARAALSKVNPCLLADIRPGSDETAANLFYACGIRTGDKPPISVATSTVFKRCRVVVPNFTEAEVRWCNEFASKRNEELHSGSSPYVLYSPDKWLADYYRIYGILLSFFGLNLADIFGPETASVAERLIAGQQAHVMKQTIDAIQSAKLVLASLTDEEIKNRAKKIPSPGLTGRRVTCPTGAHDCIVGGEITHVSAPRLDADNDIIISRTIIPTRLDCTLCGLKLATHAALAEAGVGRPFTVSSVQDPIEFHGIDIMEHVSDADMQNYIANQYEPDYGND